MDGIYALADPSSAVATINMNDEFNIFGKKAYLVGRTFTAFPPIDDAPMQKKIIAAAPEPVVEENEGSWWGNLALGTLVTAALAGTAYLAFGAATVVTGGAALILVGVCLAGSAAATATVTVAASYEDAKSGHTRTTSEFISQLAAGEVKGATTAAMLYGLWYGIPAASAMLGGELASVFSSTILSAVNFSKLSAGAGYLLMTAQAIRGGSEIESIVNGYNWMLETIFGGDENAYNEMMVLMDGISRQVILIGLMNPPKKEGERPGDITKKAKMGTDPKVEGAGNIPHPGDDSFVGPLTKSDSHFIMGDGIGQKKKGVLGAHNMDNFNSTLKSTGFSLDDLKVGDPVPHPTVEGVYSQYYRVPSYDNKGNVIGFKDIPDPKTYYDPNVISNSQMLEWGKEAMSNAKPVGNGGVVVVGTASNGLEFRGYLRDGEITNFYPIISQ